MLSPLAVANKPARPGQLLDSILGLSPLADSLREICTYGRGEKIYYGGEGADHWFCLMAGVARKCALLSDGRRRIIDFLLPGDFFGFRGRYQEFFATEAIVGGTIVARYPRRRLEAAADSDPGLGRRMREIALGSIDRSQARLLILGRVTTLEKVAAFLIEMAHRSFDRSDQTVVLPMSRYDIADYLAISVETVSRGLTELRLRGLITFVGTRRIRLRDCDALEHGIGRRSAA